MRDFIAFPLALYAEEKRYSPQLIRDQEENFSGRNPLFRHAEVSFYTAMQSGRTVGRIASVLNRRHLSFHHEKTGFFGFFESVNDPEVAGRLLEKAGELLKAKGMERMRGPMNFSTNEECGILVEGFTDPPMIMTPYNPPYYQDLMKHCGMEGIKDLLGFIFEVGEKLPGKVLRASAMAEKRGITVRAIHKDMFREEMTSFQEIYNAAWQGNWGFIPLSDDEVYYLGTRLKQIIKPGLVLIAEEQETPVGFLGLLPDFNAVLRKMRGRITPISLLKGIYYSRRISDLRLLLFGIKKEYRGKGIDALLLREAFVSVKKGGYRRIEFSWVLDDNFPVLRLIDLAGGRMYKRYRIYEKALG